MFLILGASMVCGVVAVEDGILKRIPSTFLARLGDDSVVSMNTHKPLLCLHLVLLSKSEFKGLGS